MGRRFTIQHNYKAGNLAYSKGDVVELTKDEAEHLERDSPGMLKPVKPTKKSEETQEPPKEDDSNGEGS